MTTQNAFDAAYFIQGNILLLICCGFYLAWWLIAFRPQGGIRGMKSGWLLLPAAAAGALSVWRITEGLNRTGGNGTSALKICLAGLLVYILLLVVTRAVLKRPVTTELFLIVGWAVMAAAEADALRAAGLYSSGRAAALTAVILVMAVISLVCYLRYYKLDAVKGYYDGAAPLVMVAAVTAVMLFTMI